jgi:hypothetical protein
MGTVSCKMPFWHSICEALGELEPSFPQGSGGTGGGPGAALLGGTEPGGGAYGQLKSHGLLKCGIGTRQREVGLG